MDKHNKERFVDNLLVLIKKVLLDGLPDEELECKLLLESHSLIGSFLFHILGDIDETMIERLDKLEHEADY